MKALGPFEMLLAVDQSMWCYIPENHHLEIIFCYISLRFPSKIRLLVNPGLKLGALQYKEIQVDWSPLVPL
jgi:hypothetical protein